MSLTARNAQVYKGTAAVTYGSGSGVSGSQLQGTATVTYGGAPTSNTALVTGSSNYMKLPTTDPTNFDPSTSNVFIEAWVYWSGTNWTSPSLGTIYERDNLTVQDYGLYTDNTGKLTSYMYTQNGSILRAIYNTSSLNFQQWYHVAFAYNTVNQTSYVWVNGNVGTTSTASNPARYTGSSIFTSIGASPLNGVTTAYWNGYIRDMRVVKGGNIPTTSFTPAQAPFRLNVPSYVTGGSTVLSLAEQYFNPSLLSLPGITGSFMDFSTVPVARVNTSTTSMFLETWCYFNTLTGVEQYIAGTITISTQANDDWGLRWDSGSNRIQFYHYNAASTAIGSALSLAAPNAGQWYHVAVSVVTGNPGYVYLFVNGVLQNSGGSSMSGAPRYTAASTLWLGSPGNTGWGPSNLYIQDLRIVSGGTVPTTSFTPVAAPFGLASPSYVSGGTTVLSLATQYYQTTTTGLLPQVFLAPSGTYPSYTTTSAPVFNSSNVAFTGAGYSAGNFINFGQTTITMSLGYSIMFQFAWTGSVQSAYERILDFGVAGSNNNSIIVYRTGTGTTLNFGNFSGGSAQTVTSTSTFPQNTVSGTVVCVYDPSSTGSLNMYVNGSLQATLTGITIIPNGSFPSSLIAASNATGLDPFSNVSIYSMKFYNRVLSATEIARTASPISSIQFTSRPILPAVLTNPGNNFALVSGQTITVAQTALEPANGITWGFSPTGSGLAVTSSTDYALNLVVNSTPILPNTYTVSATNKSGLTTVVQFSGSTQLIFGLFASPTATGTWYGFSYTIFTPQNSGVYPLVSLYGTSPLNSTVWDSGGVYSPGSGLPTSGASFNAYLPGTSTYGDYTRVQFSSGIVFSSVYIGLNGTNYNPISNVAVYGSNTGTAPWTQLFYGPSGLLESNYNTGTASFVKFTFTTTGSFTNYACQIPTVLPSHGNNPSTGCLYWST